MGLLSKKAKPPLPDKTGLEKLTLKDSNEGNSPVGRPGTELPGSARSSGQGSGLITSASYPSSDLDSSLGSEAFSRRRGSVDVRRGSVDVRRESVFPGGGGNPDARRGSGTARGTGAEASRGSGVSEQSSPVVAHEEDTFDAESFARSRTSVDRGGEQRRRGSVDQGSRTSPAVSAQDSLEKPQGETGRLVASSFVRQRETLPNDKRQVRSSLDIGAHERNSLDSEAASSAAHSRRSSFALERASLEANRTSLELFRAKPEGDRAVGSRAGLPPMPKAPDRRSEESSMSMRLSGLFSAGAALRRLLPDPLRDLAAALGVVQPSTPLPLSMLQKLWQTSSQIEAKALASQLSAHEGVLQMAVVDSGATWVLVNADLRECLAAELTPALIATHQSLLAAYQQGCQSLAAIPDDGYILPNLGHHLISARQLPRLKGLLSNPAFLEKILQGYGNSSVVALFRRYLMEEGDEDVKVLLEAFQLSSAICLAHPGSRLLPAQMRARLQVVQDGRLVGTLKGTFVGGEEGEPIIALEARTASLDQAGGLQRLTLRGHQAAISKVLLTPGGTDIVTGGADGMARVWDMEVGDCVLCLSGHKGPITCMASTGSGIVLLTGSIDGSVGVWELEGGECLGVLEGHAGPVHAVVVDPMGKLAVSASADGTARVWDLACCACRHVLQGHNMGSIWGLAVTPDGQRVVTSGEDFIGIVWSLQSGSRLQTLSGHSGWVIDVAIWSDEVAVSASHDTTARVWSLATGECLRVLSGHTGRLNAVRLGETDSRPVAMTISDDYTARVWDFETGTCLHVLQGHGGWLSDAALLWGKMQAVTVSGDELAVVWDLREGSCVKVLEGHAGEVRSVVATKKGRFAVTGSCDHTARVWDLQAKTQRSQRVHSGRVHGVVCRQGYPLAVTFGDDGCLVWTADTGLNRGPLKGPAVRWAVLCADGLRCVTGSPDGQIHLWHLHTLKLLSSMPGQPGSRVKSFDACSLGRVAVSALFDSSISLFDLEQMQLDTVLQTRAGKERTGHSGGVNKVLVTSDGNRALSLSKDNTCRVWDLAARSCSTVLVGHKSSVEDAVIAEDGRLAVTTSLDGQARLWDLIKGVCLGVVSPPTGPVACACPASGATALLALEDHSCQVWDLASSRLGAPLPGHREAVTGLACAATGPLIATCSRDASLRLLHHHTGKLEGHFVGDSGLTCCGFAGDATLVVGSETGTVHFLALPEPQHKRPTITMRV